MAFTDYKKVCDAVKNSKRHASNQETKGKEPNK